MRYFKYKNKSKNTKTKYLLYIMLSVALSKILYKVVPLPSRWSRQVN